MRILVPLVMLLMLVACGDLAPCHPENLRYQVPSACRGINAILPPARREIVPGYDPEKKPRSLNEEKSGPEGAAFTFPLA